MTTNVTFTPVRAISLDLWGTLLRSDPGFKPLRNEFLRSTFAPGVTREHFTQVLRRTDRALDDVSIRTGKDYDFRERVQAALTSMDKESPGKVVMETSDQAWKKVEQVQADLAREYPPIPLAPELPSLLNFLAKRLPLVVTSNTGMLPGVLMRDLLDLSGFAGVFTGHAFSNEVECCKPWPDIFTAAHAAFCLDDLTRAEVLHVGDNPVADVEGALAFGYQALLVSAESGQTVTEGLQGLLEDLD